MTGRPGRPRLVTPEVVAQIVALRESERPALKWREVGRLAGVTGETARAYYRRAKAARAVGPTAIGSGAAAPGA